MTKTLYGLTINYKDFQYMLDNPPSDFLTKEMITDCLNKIQDEIEEKVENISKVFLSNKADIAALDTEIKRLQSRKMALDNQNDWLREYLLTEMNKLGIRNIKRAEMTVYISKSRASITVEDANSIPKEFQRVVIEAKKKEIMDYFNETGEIIPGASIVPAKEFVVIK